MKDNVNINNNLIKIKKIPISKLLGTVILLILVVLGSTFAWFTYQSNKSALVLTIGSNKDVTMTIKPYQINDTMVPVNNYTSGVYSTVKVDNNSSNGSDISLFYKINNLDQSLINNGLKYTITTSATKNGEYTVLKNGTFEGAQKDYDFLILEEKIPSNSEKYYIVYIWLDNDAGDQTLIQNSVLDVELNGSLNSLYREVILNGADPVLDAGMIPVTISDIGVVTVADTSSEWYSYEDKEWANVVLVKENATQGVTGSRSREYYKENPGTTVVESDILAYYVWIPRYKYTIVDASYSFGSSLPQPIDIVFENKDTISSTGSGTGMDYNTHPAFTFGEEELNGIWVGKFETTGTALLPTIKPNIDILKNYDSGVGEKSFKEYSSGVIPIPNTNSNNKSIMQITADESLVQLSHFFDVSLKFAGGTFNTGSNTINFIGNNTYGLTNKSDSHIIKNSDWAAVAFLSHSQYGINRDVEANSSESYITGSGTNKTYGTPYNGDFEYPQSTTGNITGIFDMAGGANEYVMANYNNTTNNYFPVLPPSKYYNLYTTTNLSICGAECSGHALVETAGWYNSTYNSITTSSVWLYRGGYYHSTSNSSIFSYSSANGNIQGSYGFRTGLVIYN